MNLKIFRIICLCLLILSTSVLQIDIGGLLGFSPNEGRLQSQQGNKKSSSISGLDPDEKDFLLKQYATAVTEIQSRLEQESLLFGFKFTLVGAILAFMFSLCYKGQHLIGDSNSPERLFSIPVAAAICWAAVVTSAVIDCRIEFHSNLIITLGNWIQDHVEPFLLNKKNEKLLYPVGWETYLSQKSPLIKDRLYALLRLNANILTFLLFSATTLSFFMYLEKTDQAKTKRITCRICTIGCFFSIFVFFFVSLQFTYRNRDALLLSGLFFIIALVSSLCIWNQFHAEVKTNKQNES